MDDVFCEDTKTKKCICLLGPICILATTRCGTFSCLMLQTYPL